MEPKPNNNYKEADFKDKITLLKENIEKENKRNILDFKKSILDLWNKPRLLKYCIALYMIWFSMMFGYYGWTYNAGTFGGSIFWNTVFYAISGIVSNVLCFYLSEKVKISLFRLLFPLL